ncbi:10337_t:CDS:1, partial [Funneliformis geosporum]
MSETIFRQARARNNILLDNINELNEYEEEVLSEEINSLNINNIGFNPNKHQTQKASINISDLQKDYYINRLWRSISLSPDDCKTS